MSQYATLTNLQTYLGSQTSSTDPGVYQQVTDRVSAVTASSTVGQEALDQAEATVDSYLATKYAVPVDTSNERVATLVRGLTLKLAAFELFASCPWMGDVLDRIEKLYDDAMRFLRGIAKGETTLPGATPLDPPEADGDIALAGGNARVFDEDGIASF